MSLEATMLVVDNSNYALNGDYTPTRLQAQADAVHIIFNRKVQANPESEVGLMVMGGKAPEVLVTPTQDEGKLIAALHDVKPAGVADLNTGIQVAQLALKHRQNKNQRQRIIVFVGSPLSTTSASLVKLGKKMKKNNVAIDVISFGSDESSVDMSIPSVNGEASSSTSTSETNESKLLALHEAVNSSENSHYLHVEPGPHLLSERISASAILRGEGAGDAEMGDMGGAGGDEYGVDPNLDPELAMALRMSLEEERARQAAASGSSSAPAAGTSLESVPEASASSMGASAESSESKDVQPIKTEDAGGDDTAAVLAAAAASGGVEDVGMDEAEADEDDDLARALALSRGDDVEMGDAAGAGTAADEDDEDAEIARAIALSMQESEENSQNEEKKK